MKVKIVYREREGERKKEIERERESYFKLCMLVFDFFVIILKCFVVLLLVVFWLNWLVINVMFVFGNIDCIFIVDDSLIILVFKIYIFVIIMLKFCLLKIIWLKCYIW